MKQGALAKGKVHLPLSHGPSCYRSRELQRENVSLFWVYLHANLNVLNLDLKKKEDISGLVHSPVLQCL